MTNQSPLQANGWQPIKTAPKDGSYILAIVSPNARGRYMERHRGRVFSIRHEGITPSGFDLGWAVYLASAGLRITTSRTGSPSPPHQRRKASER